MANKSIHINQEEIEIIATHSICRLCASQNEKLMGIFSEEGIGNDLSNKINLYLPIKVSPADDLPLQCCWNCASTLLAWHELVVTCVEIDKKFRSAQFIPAPVKGPAEGGGFDNTENIISDDNNDDCDNDGFFQHMGNIGALFEAIQRREKEQLPTSDTEEQKSTPHFEEVFVEESQIEEDPDADDEPQLEEFVDCPIEIVDHKVGTDLSQQEEEKEEMTTKTTLQCEICEKILTSRSKYLSHIKTHVSDYYCKICCNSYNTKFKLDTHFSSHGISKEHVTAYSYIKCQFENCNAFFPSKFQLYKHKKTHTPLEHYTCDVCNTEFIRWSAFHKHKLSHGTVWTCDICAKTFANKKSLTQHRRFHTGDKPFKCELCHMQFKCQSALKYHEEGSHSSVKKYKCQLCPFAFTRLNYLKEHLEKHAEERRPFQCKMCNMRFMQAGMLTRHEKTVHARCGICNELVRKARDLIDHNCDT